MPRTPAARQEIEVTQITRTHERRAQRVVVESIEEVREGVNLNELAAGVSSRNISRAVEAIPLDEVPRRLQSLEVSYRSAVEAGAESAIDHTPLSALTVAASLIIFDPLSPLVVDFIREQVGDLITQVDQSTVLAVRAAVQDAVDSGLPARAAARRIRDMVGMTERMVQANNRLRISLEEQGAPEEVVERRTRQHARRSINRRAETIARTEMGNAVGFGRQRMWEQASDEGLLDEQKIERMWITAQDERVDCVICEPMNGQRRMLREPFLTGDGRAVMQSGGVVHVNDRCTVAIVPARRRR